MQEDQLESRVSLVLLVRPLDFRAPSAFKELLESQVQRDLMAHPAPQEWWLDLPASQVLLVRLVLRDRPESLEPLEYWARLVSVDQLVSLARRVQQDLKEKLVQVGEHLVLPAQRVRMDPQA